MSKKSKKRQAREQKELNSLCNKMKHFEPGEYAALRYNSLKTSLVLLADNLDKFEVKSPKGLCLEVLLEMMIDTCLAVLNTCSELYLRRNDAGYSHLDIVNELSNPHTVKVKGNIPKQMEPALEEVFTQILESLVAVRHSLLLDACKSWNKSVQEKLRAIKAAVNEFLNDK